MVQPRSLPDILRQSYEVPKLVNDWCVQQVTWALMALRSKYKGDVSLWTEEICFSITKELGS
jgi:hypothetical protein